MAYRATLASLLSKTRSLRPLLARQPAQFSQRIQRKSDIMPCVPFLNSPKSMFSREIIMKYWECIPIITFTLVGFSTEVAWIIRQCLTRDDVRYNKKMLCEYVEMNPNKKPPIRKFYVENQKYETPPGLIEALREPTPKEREQMCRKNKKQC